MKFASPAWLWVLILVPAAYVALLWDERRRQARFEAFARRSLWPWIAPEADPRAKMRKMLLWLGVVFFSILALARPQWGTKEEVAKMSGLDVMAVLDVSNSMLTEDVVPSRLKKAKHFLRSLAERLQGDRLGLVTFAGGASVATPLTTDTDYFLNMLQIQGPSLIPTQGTDIGLGLETAMRAMDRGAVNSSSPDQASGQNDDQKPSRAIVLITDGEDFGGVAKQAAARLKSKGIRLYVLGVGTQKGGPIPIRDDSGSLENYKRDRSGQPVISSFHPDSLLQIASAAGGRYWNVTTDEGEIRDLLKDMGALSRGEFAEHHYLIFEDRFQYPLAIAVLLLILEISLSARGDDRRKRSAGVASALMLILCGAAFGVPSLARATSLGTYQENEKGVRAYKEGKIEEARKRFGEAQAQDPDLPELQYNQGLVQMQQGKADDAAHDFAQAARGAMKNHDSKLLGRSFFNLGEALSKKGDVKGALQSYLGAIASARKSGDGSLESDARKNIQLLIQQQQQQKQQQQQNQNQKQKNDQQDQKNKASQQDKNSQNKGNAQEKMNSQKQSQQGDQQKNDQGDQQPKRYDNSTSRGQKFKSQKLSADDAERVMEELTNRESELQRRLKKQNGKYDAEDKDW